MNAPRTIGDIAYRLFALAALSLLVGVVVSILAIGFVDAVVWLNDWLYVSPRSRIQLNNPWLTTLITILVPTIGGLIVGILLQYGAKEKRPLGPPDVIKSVQLHCAMPSTRGGIISTLAATVSLGCGASVGQYGPMVYLGGMIGSLMKHVRLSISHLSSIAIACGVAAAISTAFNAPIAGLVFAHEVILRHYSMRAFAPTTVAAATGYVMTNVVFDRPPLFLVEFSGVQHGYEFLLFAILGLICALLAVAFMKLILSSATLAQRSKLPSQLRPALAGMLVGIIAIELPDVLGVGKEVLRFATIEGAFSAGELVLLVIAKMLLTALCIGFGFVGGVFSPALLVGILFGALFWFGVDASGLANSGLVVYAISGMMALTSPVIGAPLTTILIVFELTRNYDLTIAAMVCVVFSNLLAYRAFGRSLFDVQLAKKGINLSFGRDRAILEHTLVIERELDSPLFCSAQDKIGELARTMREVGRAEAVVVDQQQRYCGVIRLQDCQQATGNAEDIMRTEWPTYRQDTSLWQAMQILDDFIGEGIPVVHSESAEVLGIISEAALIRAYLQTVHNLREEENEAV